MFEITFREYSWDQGARKVKQRIRINLCFRMKYRVVSLQRDFIPYSSTKYSLTFAGVRHFEDENCVEKLDVEKKLDDDMNCKNLLSY